MTPAIDGAGVKTPEEGSSSSSGPSSSREYLQKWIQQQSSSFLEKWSEPARGHPALGVVKKLNESSQDLNPESHNCVAALQVNIHKIFLGRGVSLKDFGTISLYNDAGFV